MTFKRLISRVKPLISLIKVKYIRKTTNSGAGNLTSENTLIEPEGKLSTNQRRGRFIIRARDSQPRYQPSHISVFRGIYIL